MNPKTVLSLSAVYMALVGLGMLLAPSFMSLGLITTPEGLNVLRIDASMAVGIALLNWFARGSDASKARDAILLGNTVGFSMAAVVGLVLALMGGPVEAWGFVAINLVIAALFLIVGPKNMSTRAA